MSDSGSNNDDLLLDRLIDRMVDGELDRRAQTELLARLDERPGDWRRLALAFVEAQTLGTELRGMLKDAKSAPVHVAPAAVPNETVHTVATHSVGAAPWSQLLSLAATLFVAVGIGFGAGRVWNRPQSDPSTGTTLPVGTLPVNTSETGDDISPTYSTLDQLAPQGTMTVQTADGSPVELPVYAASYGAERMLSGEESSVPPEVIRALRSRGHEVSQQRRYWPVELSDGRQIIVPVDQVDVQYVGDRAYQ
jgi:hypothetical protein